MKSCDMIIQMKTLWRYYFLAGLKSEFWILVLSRAHFQTVARLVDFCKNIFLSLKSYVTGQNIQKVNLIKTYHLPSCSSCP